MENNETKEYDVREDPEFIEQALEACMDLGLTEDEAEREVEDYLDMY